MIPQDPDQATLSKLFLLIVTRLHNPIGHEEEDVTRIVPQILLFQFSGEET